MKHNDFFKQLKTGEIKSVYLFTGEEQYVMKSALKQLEGKVVDKDYRDVNLSVLPSNATGSEICAACETFPFFSKNRMVVLDESVFLTKGAGKCEGEELFLDYLDHPCESTVLAVTCRTPDKRRKIYKALSEHALVEFDALNGQELSKWIEKTLKGFGLGIEPSAVSFLMEYAEARPEALITELEKLADYKGEGVVNKEDILSIVTPCNDYNIFKMVDAIFSRDTKTALTLLSRMLIQREEPIYVLGAISKQCRQMLNIKLMLQEKVPRQDIYSLLDIKDFQFKKYDNFSRKISVEALRRAVELCYKTDEGLKTGLMFDGSALHALVLQLSRI